MRLLAFTGDGFEGAILQANKAASAFFRIHGIGQQRSADFCRAFFMEDMCFVFIAEVSDRGKHRVRSCLSQSAKRIILDLVSQLFQLLKIVFRAFTIGNPFEDSQACA